jgi:hypothetical protein
MFGNERVFNNYHTMDQERLSESSDDDKTQVAADKIGQDFKNDFDPVAVDLEAS